MSTTSGQQHPGEPPEGRHGTVVADMSVSLDGFVADPDDGVDRVFAWYGKAQPPRRSAADRDSSGLGVIIYGRRTFEVANGWVASTRSACR
jgi:hypothetical protein